MNGNVVILVLLGHFLMCVFSCACTIGVSENAVLYFDILRFLAKQFSLKAQFTTSWEFGTASLNMKADDIRQSFSISRYQFVDNIPYSSLFPVEEQRSSILNYKNTSERRRFLFQQKGK